MRRSNLPADSEITSLTCTAPNAVRVYLKYQAEFPKSYQELEKLWTGGA